MKEGHNSIINIEDKYINLKEDVLKEIGIKLTKNASMKKRVSFRAGGSAKFLAEVRTIDELRELLLLLKKREINYFFLGNGSNVLFRDGIYDGVVITTLLENYSIFEKIQILEYGEAKAYEVVKAETNEVIYRDLSCYHVYVKAYASEKNGKLANFLLDNSLTGFEFAAGIPGSIGGAVYMNAGAYGGEIGDCIVSVEVLQPATGEIINISKKELNLSYRHSRFMDGDEIILSAIFRFKRGDKTAIREAMSDFAQRRREKQPLNYPSCGSFFKRPLGYFAGKLIEDGGLKGYRVGGASVSNKHSGFIINEADATASDIIDLMHHCQEVVFDKFGVRLEPEVRIV